MALSKPVKQHRKQWSSESMAAAIEMIEGGMGVREASRLYNLPYETLRRRVNHVVNVECRPGPPTVLTDEEEKQLADYCVKMADMGFGLSREDVMLTAFRIAEISGRKHPFTKGSAGRSWFDGFRSRHQNLTIRSAQSLSHSRAACANENVIRDYFAKLGALCARLNILTKPMQIFNMDETGLSIVHKPGRVLTQVGRRNVWAITSAEKGKTHTVLTCASASGYALPPFMIYPRKRITDKLKVGAVPGTVFHCSDSGWVNGPLFLKWFEFFLKNIPPIRPILLLLDGHASHISIDVIELARVNDVHMLCLPAHTTHILQPLDVRVFKSLKAFYYKACKKYISDHSGRVITTDVIASLLAVAWPQSVTPVNIMAGFKKSGVYPLNPGEVTDRQIAPSIAACEVKRSDEANDMSPELESVFEKRYQEGYDIYSKQYISWLHQHHPESIPAEIKLTPAVDVSANCAAGSTDSPPLTTSSKCYCAKVVHYLANWVIRLFINTLIPRACIVYMYFASHNVCCITLSYSCTYRPVCVLNTLWEYPLKQHTQ